MIVNRVELVITAVVLIIGTIVIVSFLFAGT
jgi:hypothetical protein